MNIIDRTNPNGNHFTILAVDTPVEDIKLALAQHPELWDQNDLRTSHVGSAHSDVSDIWIRFNRPDQGFGQQVDATNCFWYPASSVVPAEQHVYSLMSFVRGEQIGRVIITKLPPGGKIEAHEDKGPPAEFYQRFHLCIQNEDGAVFTCGDEQLTPEPGMVYWINNAEKHSVENNSNADRITMIMDIRTMFGEAIKPTYNINPEAVKMTAREKAIKGSIKKTDYPEGVSIQVERWNDCIAELLEYEVDHWNELGLDHQDVPQDINFDLYAQMDNAGSLHVVTARLDGHVIGYHISFVKTNPHYMSTLHAHVDLYYLKPEHRKSKIGVQMFKFAEQTLKEKGVVKLVTPTKLHLHHGALFRGLGYNEVETVFTKILNPSGSQ